MVENQPSKDLDALFNIGAPAQQAAPPAQQLMTRRQMREVANTTPSSDAVATKPHSTGPRPTKPRKLKGAEVRALRRTSAKSPRKNPISTLATMAVVGGLFAVAGLPAYAFSEQEITADAVSNVGAQSVVVSGAFNALVPVRDEYHATTPGQLAQMRTDAIRAANQAAYLASGAREAGDDYPWPYELTDDQGGGLSPLNYYYRECVDFVAWRLNRDAGYYAAPFKWVWSNLTPLGGNGGQWMYNWQAKGWPVSKTPVVGAVAYTGGNHIAYVKSVNADGTVTLEEYNYIPGQYGQRVLPASSVVAFLYPPS